MTREVSAPNPISRNILEVVDLSKVYGTLRAVQGLTVSVEPGEILGLVGPNGAGKSTTLRSLAGILRPTTGRIRILGVDLARQPVAAKRRLAFVPDEPQLFEYLTVEEHLEFTARLYQQHDAKTRMPALLRRLELTDKRAALAGTLSRGMRQKLAIGCALLHDPDLLLLDEPLTGLDPAGIRQMKQTIRAVAEGGGAVVLSSHLLTLVEELCTRVLILHGGRTMALGSLEAIARERPELTGLGLEDIFVSLTGDDRRPD